MLASLPFAVPCGTLHTMAEQGIAVLAAPDLPDPAGERLRRFQAGDHQAFAELVAEHQALALAVANRITADRDAAADVVQEAFLRLVRHAGDYRPDRPFRPWFLHIVRNLAIDCLRRRRPLAAVEHLAEATAPVVADATERSELRVRVAAILSELPDKYRTILIMRELEGIPAEDIAEQIGVDYGTTRWRLHQARRLFRDRWIARHGDWP
ncbi:DNA-directed RNA polymerase sigma-70 factor [Planctomycetota bacterium]|nr:DNA-directed RNA polymerase sigma-70 factor [Planctomycetota bacterium]